MADLWPIMEMRRLQLEQWLADLEKRLRKTPKGHLKVRQSRDRIQYYMYPERDIAAGMGDKTLKERYLGKSQAELAQRLGQRDYDRDARNLIRNELRAIEQFRKKTPVRVEQLYDALSEGRKRLVAPLALTDRQYLELWGKREYVPKLFREGTPVYYTAKKERVRSKSEVLIADTLNRYGIPYLYECPVQLGDRTIYPDFTLPDPVNRADVYLEHLGMMDNGAYGGDSADRLDFYREHGIVPGIGLILSFETSRHPLNVIQIEELIELYLPWYKSIVH